MVAAENSRLSYFYLQIQNPVWKDLIFLSLDNMKKIAVTKGQEKHIFSFP